jgi:hypothetical protein
MKFCVMIIFLNFNLHTKNMKRILYLLLLFCFAGCTTDNIVINSGAELPPLEQGWVSAAGSNWMQRQKAPLAKEGKSYFFPGVAARAELVQDVDVKKYAFFIDHGFMSGSYSGYVRSFPQRPADVSWEVLEFRGADGAVIDSFTSRQFDSTANWIQIKENRKLPPGTRTIRIKLVSERHNGSNNDGYHDDISLTLSNSLIRYLIVGIAAVVILIIFLLLRRKKYKGAN